MSGIRPKAEQTKLDRHKAVFKVKMLLLKIKPIRYYVKGRSIHRDPYFLEANRRNDAETKKSPSRTDIINFLLSLCPGESCYLEIGVRNPADNFNHIRSSRKYGVDPGMEFAENPVDFKMKSDDFFGKLDANEIFTEEVRFDVIFIDGLHLAEQADKDIRNALNYIKDNGFIVLHDCNPPTQWHARELFEYRHTPANSNWNGTTWKAFLKWRCNPSVYSCCIDSDWGVGIISKQVRIGQSFKSENEFYEFSFFERNRKEALNLVDFSTFKELVRNI